MDTCNTTLFCLKFIDFIPTMCCLLCFSDEPIDDNPKELRLNHFQITMLQASCTKFCLLTCLCPPCVAYHLRYRSLGKDMTNYQCCQGYINCFCFQGGSMGETNCPEFCLCLEAFCCLGPSMSSTRLLLMDQNDLKPDPCDNRLIRFNNCMMLFSCFCDILAAFDENLRQLANLIDCITNIVFYSTIGCMGSQINNELDRIEATKKFNQVSSLERSFNDLKSIMNYRLVQSWSWDTFLPKFSLISTKNDGIRSKYL